MDFAADLAPMLADFGQTATLSVGGSATVIFDAVPADAFGLVAGHRYSATGRTVELAAVTIGSTMTIGGAAYTVATREDDLYGASVIALDAA